ncbi:MAG: hypothetical protein VX619_00340 [bacterium]|nr:hypothetical protein [bacterium]
METFEEKQFRLREVRAFLLFQCKVLRNHRKRKVIEAEQEPQFLVGSGMSYELQKMEEFLTQSETIEKAYIEVITFIKNLRVELDSGNAQQNLAEAKDFFAQIETLMDKIGQNKF